MAKNRVIPQMFDVRPVDKTGNLDWEKIKRVEESARPQEFVAEYNREAEWKNVSQAVFGNLERDLPLDLNRYENIVEKRRVEEEIAKREELEKRVYALEAQLVKQNERTVVAPAFVIETERAAIKEKKEEGAFFQKRQCKITAEDRRMQKVYLLQEKKKQKAAEQLRRRNERIEKKMRKMLQPGYFTFSDLLGSFVSHPFGETRKVALAFAAFAFLIVAGIGSVSFAYKSIGIKGTVLGVSQGGVENLAGAVSEISKQNFQGSSEKFTQAFEHFSQASQEMDQIGTLLNEGSRFLPYVSKLSSGKNMLEAGKHLSLAGKYMNDVMEQVQGVRSPGADKSQISFLEMFKQSKQSMWLANGELTAAQENLEKVKIDDLPEDMRDKFSLLRTELPKITELSDSFLKNSNIFTDLLGGNGPRKYLFLFQNNNEMRATGGFIGSYGLLDISDGHIRNFFIDGIFNPDGQLKEKIIPPKPIQKISAAWSLHDSNWFPDFPTSAKEAILFYEKTGGPTVDGVITFTPTVMQNLLKITGPIEMPEYEVILDSENFVEKTQYEVEQDYDKMENEPKKILADLASILLERIINSEDPQILLRFAQVFLDGLGEKHILFYSENKDLQAIISQKGWSGEILQAKKDYLSVINTNINGYKTDGVIAEKIEHQAEISKDGSIVNTVSVTRKHNGGNSDYEWWNKVNANYMRVYVPEGSELLNVEGQTREINESPLDYEKLGFKTNELVQKEEANMSIDEKTGTRIYTENGKTVFANWTYVSPQETMTITYKYRLPFKLFPTLISGGERVDSYSLVAQKQSGSVGSEFLSKVNYPASYGDIKWNYPENLEVDSGTLGLTGKLDTDKFIGVVFEKQ